MIKFRAYSKSRGDYLDWKSDLRWYPLRALAGEDGCSDDLVFEQFTGIQDRSGQDIYEGDIVSCDDSSGKWLVLFGAYFTVNDVGCGFHLAENGDRNGFPRTICGGLDSGKYKIIGNINKNPNLL